MRPGETDAKKKRIFFNIFDTDGFICSGEVGEGAVFVPIAAELKISRDEVAYAAATLSNFAHLGDGLYRYEFDNAEIAGATEGEITLRVKKIGTIRTVTVTTPLRFDNVDTFTANAITNAAFANDAINAAKVADGTIDAATFAAGAINAAAIADGAIDAATFAAGAINAAAIATNAIDADALAPDGIAEIQSGLATAANLAVVATYIDTEVAAIKAKTDNLPVDPADASDIAAAFAVIQADITRLLGLHHDNSVTDGGFGFPSIQRDSGKRLLTLRRRVFASKAAAIAATLGAADNADGEIFRYIATSTVDLNVNSSLRSLRDL